MVQKCNVNDGTLESLNRKVPKSELRKAWRSKHVTMETSHEQLNVMPYCCQINFRKRYGVLNAHSQREHSVPPIPHAVKVHRIGNPGRDVTNFTVVLSIQFIQAIRVFFRTAIVLGYISK